MTQFALLLADGSVTPWREARDWVDSRVYRSVWSNVADPVAVLRCREKSPRWIIGDRVGADGYCSHVDKFPTWRPLNGDPLAQPWREVDNDPPDWHDVGKWVQLTSEDEFGGVMGRLEAEEYYETPVFKVAGRSFYDFTHWRLIRTATQVDFSAPCTDRVRYEVIGSDNEFDEVGEVRRATVTIRGIRSDPGYHPHADEFPHGR